MTHTLLHPLWQALSGKRTFGEKKDLQLASLRDQAPRSGLALSRPASPCPASEWPGWGPSPAVGTPVALLQRRNKACLAAGPPWWPALINLLCSRQMAAVRAVSQHHSAPVGQAPYVLFGPGTAHQARNHFSSTTNVAGANASNSSVISSELMATRPRLSSQL